MFISWVRHHGRSADLASALGIEAHFLPAEIDRYRLLRKYIAALRWTRGLLRRNEYDAVIIMLPPAPLLIAALLFKKRDATLFADLHTGFFSDRRWSWFTATGLRLLRGHSVIVTNNALARRAERAGVEAWVLDDILTDRGGTKFGEDPSRHVLCPLSYANDEPVEAILNAARQTPEQQYLLTGKAPDHVRAVAPSNITFTGYVDNHKYDELIATSLAVMALTKRDLTMQRAGYEALMNGRPQITSDFQVLREFLGSAACYVRPNDADGIADAVRIISRDEYIFEKHAQETLAVRIAEQRDGIARMRDQMGGRNTGARPEIR